MATLFIFGRQDSAPVTYERTEKVMGTLVTLKASDDDAQAAVDESFTKIFEFVENVKVDVKNLNDGAGNGEFVKISPEVFEVLKISQDYSAKTNGAFDVKAPALAVGMKRRKKTCIFFFLLIIFL